MKRIQMPKPVYICFLSIPLILLILIFSFSVSSINHRHHSNLVFSTYELIVVAKSSRVAVFVTCNVIIITIFLGSLKSPAGRSDRLCSLCPSVHETHGAREEENDGDFNTVDGDEEDEEEKEEKEEDVFHGYDGYDEENDDDVDEEDVDSEDEMTDGSDLQMKIEEFIDKVYKKWKEEIIAERLLCIAATEFS